MWDREARHRHNGAGFRFLSDLTQLQQLISDNSMDRRRGLAPTGAGLRTGSLALTEISESVEGPLSAPFRSQPTVYATDWRDIPMNNASTRMDMRMMDFMGGLTIWGMGIVGLLVIVLPVLGVAVLPSFLSGPRR